MANGNLEIEDVRQMAADIGMTHLTTAHLTELLRATNAARARRSVLQNDSLTYADEPAHVFSLTAGDAS
jgi:hypothetical protein